MVAACLVITQQRFLLVGLITVVWTDMHKSNKYKILVLPYITLLLLLMLATFSRASQALPASSSTKPLMLSDEVSEDALGLHLDILEDSSGELNFKAVSSAAYDAQFIPSLVAVPYYGFTDSVYWVRVTLDNQTQQAEEWLMELGFSNIQYVDLYSPSQDGTGIDLRQTGTLRPISTRDVVYPNIVFAQNIPSQETQTFYLCFQCEASMTLPMTLWTKEAFIASSGQSLVLHWLLFGGLLALLVYHLFMLFSLREITYLYLFILLVGIIAVLLEYLGYMSVYFFLNLYPYKTYYFPVFVAVMYALIILFSDSFLELKTRLPRLHRIKIGLLVGWGVLVLLVPFISYLNIARLMAPEHAWCSSDNWCGAWHHGDHEQRSDLRYGLPGRRKSIFRMESL